MGGTPPAHRSPAAITPAASLRQLIDSLNREQRRNQELLASLGFALRSFTNLSRFLELVPLLTSRLVEAEGAVLLTFRSDGGLWREQLHCRPSSVVASCCGSWRVFKTAILIAMPVMKPWPPAWISWCAAS